MTDAPEMSLGRAQNTIAIQAARIATLEARVDALTVALCDAASQLDGKPDYHDEGMGCGLEDRNINDRYEAMAFGWEEAMERVYSEHVNGAVEALTAAISPPTDHNERGEYASARANNE